ncbi:MAG: hypothetical protein IPO67_23360 [Deltaproteobacteria bacterium]|nr:hypothetical protein [Deltaproteobacteria bacterium]
MPEISLTDFVNFVTRIGSARLTLVREIRSRGDYDPIRDFWRDLRDGLVTSTARASSTSTISMSW